MKKRRVLVPVLLLALLLTSCGAPEAPQPAVYDDSLLSEAYTEEGVFQSEWEEVPYAYHVPKLLADTEDAASINEELETQIGTQVRESLEIMQKGEMPYYAQIGWHSYWYGSLLSLVVEMDTVFQSVEYAVYNYDFETGERVWSEDLLSRAGVSREEFLTGLGRAAARQFELGSDSYEPDAFAYYTAMRARTLSRENLDRAELYLDQNGSLKAVTTIAVPAGSGFYDVVLEPEFPGAEGYTEQAVSGFVTAELRSGAVTVTFHETEHSDLYLSPGVEYEVPYPVEGLYGDYTDIAMGVLGQDFFPHIFLTDSSGRVTFCNVIGCGRRDDRFFAVGPLLGLSDVVSYEEAEMSDEGSAWQTVFAITADGARVDLGEYVAKAEDMAAPDMENSTWVSEEDPGSVDYFEYIRERQIPAALYDSGKAADGRAACTGWLTYAGTTDMGQIYYCSLRNDDFPTGEPGEEWRGGMWETRLTLLRILDGDYAEGTPFLELELLSGPELMGLPEGERCLLERSWG